MGNFLKILAPILGITFWVVLGLWYFEYSDTNSTENTRQEKRWISIYAKTDKADEHNKKLYFNYDASQKYLARKSAKKSCQDALNSENSNDEFYCKEVTLFSKGCYIRYRIGTGYASDVAETLNEADINAKNACKPLALNSEYSCLKDTIKCVEKVTNQGTRNWYYLANGITEFFELKDSSQRVMTSVIQSGYSRDDAREKAEQACLEKSGKKCKVIVSTEGDQCVALSYSGEYAIAHGRFDQEKELMNKVSASCKAKNKRECVTVWSCELK